MAFTLSAMRTAVSPGAIAGEFAQDRKRRMKREDLDRMLKIIGGVGSVVGIGRGISGIATDVSRRRLMGARAGLEEGFAEEGAFSRMIREAALPAALRKIAGPRPPAPQPEAPPGFQPRPGGPRFGKTVPREPESLEDLIGRASAAGAGQPGIPGQLGTQFAVGQLGLPPQPVPIRGTAAARGGAITPEQAGGREALLLQKTLGVPQAPPAEDLTGPSGTEATLGAITQLPIAGSFAKMIGRPVGEAIASLMDLAPDPAKVEEMARPAIEESAAVRTWGQTLERSLGGMDPAQRETMLNKVEATVGETYKGNTGLRDWMIRIIESLRGGGRAFGAGRTQ